VFEIFHPNDRRAEFLVHIHQQNDDVDIYPDL
jgi:hypothetical protein